MGARHAYGPDSRPVIAPGGNPRHASVLHPHHLSALRRPKRKKPMNSIIYIVGLVVVVLFILSMLGLR